MELQGQTFAGLTTYSKYSLMSEGETHFKI